VTDIHRARHRAAHRPLTALDDLASAASISMATVGRRSAVVVASGGLVMTMAIPASAASTVEPASSLPPVDVSALTAEARAVLATSPVVLVPQQAAWSFDAPQISVVANPKPVVVRTTTTHSTTARAEATSPVPQAVAGNAVLEIAARYVGVPYVSGGESPDGFDCSGFVQYVYGQLGISLPRTTGSYPDVGTQVSRADALPGDIIWSPGHVAIYAGDNMEIDSPRPGKTIQFREIWQSTTVFIRVTG
jgi:peptidoglycan DL-endopeptidase CwlO